MTFRERAFLATLLVFTLYIPASEAFQSPSPTISITPRSRTETRAEDSVPEPALRSDASMVLVPAQVTTRSGAPVLGLHQNDFRIFENGIAQDITYFVRDDAPVSVGLLFDSSGSMKTKMKRSADAAAALFKRAHPDDEFFLIEFDEEPRIKVPFTKDIEWLQREITRTRPFGRTSLFDAIGMALGLMKHANHERRALVILSDGGDNRSHTTFTTIKNAVVESEVQIYAMGIFDPEEKESDTREEADGPELLNSLADLTGGRHFPVKIEELTTISATVAELLRNQYLLGYSPDNDARDGTYRSITLELAAPGDNPVSIRHRKGYRAPSN